MHSYRIFLSYCSEDEAYAKRLVETLTAIRLVVFWDHKLTPGNPFTPEIKTTISRSHLFIVLLTRASKDRPWVHQETGYAMGVGVPILPIAVDIIVLAGYMRKLGPETLSHFTGRILNIHPALLPKYGGKGMYGMHVHEAVVSARETESGVSIHIVDADYDTGPIIAQARVLVELTDTAETLAERVLRREHTFFPETLQKIANGEIVLPIQVK